MQQDGDPALELHRAQMRGAGVVPPASGADDSWSCCLHQLASSTPGINPVITKLPQPHLLNIFEPSELLPEGCHVPWGCSIYYLLGRSLNHEFPWPQHPFLPSPSPSAIGIQDTGPNPSILLAEGHEVCYSHSWRGHEAHASIFTSEHIGFNRKTEIAETSKHCSLHLAGYGSMSGVKSRV